MTFRWQHREDRLEVELEGPAGGWIAVGFNDAARLLGTRFVIAAVLPDGTMRVQERVAIPGGHEEIMSLGGRFGLRDVAGKHVADLAKVAFSLPIHAGDDHAVSLASGNRTHLMLAWAHEPDFSHHSAWRRHFDITL